jgi:uncharacterized protein with gpF-like domain
MPTDPQTLRAVVPNAGFEEVYRRLITEALAEMQADIVAELTKAWRDNPPEMTEDASPAETLRALMAKLSKQWGGKFDALATNLGAYFGKSVLDRSDRQLMAILRRGGFTVKFKMTREINDVLRATINENVALIKSIASQHLSEVEGLVMRSVAAGRDLKQLTDDLTKRYEITRGRAVLIARDQNNKATANIVKTRQLSVGIEEGEWRHSRGGNHPRIAHVRFSGQRFSLREGHDFGDGFGPVLPGQAINCKCTWRPIIPGLERSTRNA